MVPLCFFSPQGGLLPQGTMLNVYPLDRDWNRVNGYAQKF